MLTIIGALKQDEKQTRLTCGDNWLVWNNESSEWVVYQHRAYQKKTRVVYRGENQLNAVKELLKES